MYGTKRRALKCSKIWSGSDECCVRRMGTPCFNLQALSLTTFRLIAVDSESAAVAFVCDFKVDVDGDRRSGAWSLSAAVMTGLAVKIPWIRTIVDRDFSARSLLASISLCLWQKEEVEERRCLKLDTTRIFYIHAVHQKFLAEVVYPRRFRGPPVFRLRSLALSEK